MKFYNSQHEFYCGIDLHANSMHLCVVDQLGKNLLHRNFDTKAPHRFLDALSPFRENDLIVGCESTFNCYWLADLCSFENLPFLLRHALYLKAIQRSSNMVFTLSPSAHLRSLATAVGIGTFSRNSNIARFVQGGVVKTFRCTT